MPVLERSYTSGHRVAEDKSVSFDCSQDRVEWPWLALPPQHPLVIQTQNFWSSVGASQALASRDDSKWSALTWTRWKLGDPQAEIADHGLYSASGESPDGKKMSFDIRLMDASDRLIVSLQGRGVVFRTRDFETWREKSKTSARPPKPLAFEYAEQKLLGLSDREPSLIAPLQISDGVPRTTALITKENGLMPGHPYFSGSGDHVNAPHLAEVARQVACLINDGMSHPIDSAEMDMHRYIELGVPFEIVVESQSRTSLSIAISQLDRSCAKISMSWDSNCR